MKKITKIFLILGLLFIGLAFSLLCYLELEDINSSKKSALVMNTILKDINEKNTDEKVLNINGFNYIGYLVIPSLDINLPITANYTEESLKISPSLYYGSVNKNMIICGHAYKSQFKYLYQLKTGDKVIFTDINNNTYVYEVVLIEEIKQNEINKMLNSEFDLTLYTCTFNNLSRVTVRCKKIS